ncbi:MAG: restriction endonuclease [Bacilli bacterium]
MSSGSSLNKALRQFEAAQANLVKLERVWNELQEMIPAGIVFGTNEQYEDKLRSYELIINSLPKISGFKPETIPLDLNEIAYARLDANETRDFESQVYVERTIDAPRTELREYRFRLQNLRKQLVRNAVSDVIDKVENLLIILGERYRVDELDDSSNGRQSVANDVEWARLKDLVDELNALLGDSVQRPSRWGDLLRHLRFAQLWDLHDIVKADWPMVKSSVWSALAEDDDPIPSEVADLSELVAQKPVGPIATRLLWENLTDEEFERLIFVLISSEGGYENPEWLMKTRAADKGRDLSATRVIKDGLSGVTRQRVIIQCKHYLKTSIALEDISTLQEQIKLWQPPRVDVLIIATSGRFTSDAVAWIEQHNQSNSALRIEMWPESHIENVLASRPAIVGEFRLR